MLRKNVIGLALTAVFLTSCGVYTFNPRGKSDYQSIAVERFENQTTELGLEDRLTDQVIDAFIADGTMKVLPRDNADVALQGKLVSYNRRPYEFTETDEVVSYQVSMTFTVTLVNPRDNVEIWTENMNQLGTYDVVTETEEDAQQEAIEKLVESVLNKTTRSW